MIIVVRALLAAWARLLKWMSMTRVVLGAFIFEYGFRLISLNL
jgi:hypothetical protein